MLGIDEVEMEMRRGGRPDDGGCKYSRTTERALTMCGLVARVATPRCRVNVFCKTAAGLRSNNIESNGGNVRGYPSTHVKHRIC